MLTYITLILLQLNLFSSNTSALSGSHVYVQELSSNEIVAHTRIASSGNFLFSNLDPGNYALLVEIPDNTVKALDKKERQKFETNIMVGFNKRNESICWQRNDGYVKLALTRLTKIAETYTIQYEPVNLVQKNETEETEEKKGFFSQLFKQGGDPTGKVSVLQFTVIRNYGSISGNIQSISQRDYYREMVGTGKLTLEEMSKVQPIVKDE